MEDNALASHNNLLNNVYSTPGPHHHTMGHGHSHIHTTPHHHHHHTPAPTPHHQHSTPLPHSSYPSHTLSHTPHHHQHQQDGTAPQVETILQSTCFCARYELILILKEIKVKKIIIHSFYLHYLMFASSSDLSRYFFDYAQL